MLGTNEPVSKCLKTEFTEEALGTLMDDVEQRTRIQTKVDELFSNGIEVRTYSHQAKAEARAKKYPRTSKKDQEINGKRLNTA